MGQFTTVLALYDPFGVDVPLNVDIIIIIMTYNSQYDPITRVFIIKFTWNQVKLWLNQGFEIFTRIAAIWMKKEKMSLKFKNQQF